MTKLVAINGTTQRAVLASNGSFVTIDTNLRDVVDVADTFTAGDSDGWVSYNYTGAPKTWAELAEAATTSLSIESADKTDPDRLFRVPKNVQSRSKKFSGQTTTLGQIHEFAQSKYYSPEKSKPEVREWVGKVLRKHPLEAPLTAAGAFAADPDLMYYGRSVDDETANCDKLYAQKDSDGSWVERVGGQWQPIEDPSEEAALLLLDPESAEALAGWVDNPDELNGDSFEFSNHNPIEFGLFAAAEAELDMEFLDRLFDIYDSTERSINASKQVRSSGGKFSPNPGGGDAAPQAPKARLSVRLPLVPNISQRIDEYLAQVAKERGEEAPEPAEGAEVAPAGPAPVNDEAEKNDKRETNTFLTGDEIGLSQEYQDAVVEAFAVTAQQAGVPESDVKPLYVAIVDDIDVDAVLDLVSLVPPKAGEQGDVSAWKRAAGQWVAAPEILSALRSSTPPSVVELPDEAVLKEVIEQVDKSTADEQTEDQPVDGETEVSPEGTPAPAAAPLPDKGPAPVKTSNFEITGRLELMDGKAYMTGAAVTANQLREANGFATLEDEAAAIRAEFKQKTALDSESRDKAADKGNALPDGSFPINNKEDLKKAVHAYGRAKDKPKAKRHITKRAKALDATDLLPGDWDGSTAAVDLLAMAARGFAFSDGSMLIRNSSDLRAALSEADTLEKQVHYIRRARALNRMDLVPKHWQASEASIAEDLWGPHGELVSIAAAGGADQWRGNAERLRRYWTTGIGGIKVMWGTPRDWTRCVAHLSKYLGVRAKGYCALRHYEMNGYYPGDRRNK